MLNPFNYRIEYKLNNKRSSHYKQVSILGDLCMQLKGSKIIRRYEG